MNLVASIAPDRSLTGPFHVYENNDLNFLGEDGTCLGEVTIPASWWPSLTASRLAKQPQVVVRALYWVVAECRQAGGPLAELVTAPALVGELPLTLSQMGYRQLAGRRNNSPRPHRANRIVYNSKRVN